MSIQLLSRLVPIVLVSCVAGMGAGGGFTWGGPRGPTGDGLHARFSTGVGYGTPNLLYQATLDLHHIGSHNAIGGTVEGAYIHSPTHLVRPRLDSGETWRGLALSGRTGYSAGSDGLRTLELSLGVGFGAWNADKGNALAALYITSYRHDSPVLPVSWSCGLMFAFSASLTDAFEAILEQP